ncbi:MAG: AAA family ATPase [Chitinophagaceae bacterium]|nr:MAG: AAA family ATPase [Chitinophagaceae bacterium]
MRMSSLSRLLKALAAAHEKGLIICKDYRENDVAEAVEKLAAETGKPVQRVALSSVAGQYLAETEKALQAILERAKDSGAILFFDEADALFGKRTDVKDAHDRYANRKASYLLQQLEAYNGTAVVAASNKRGTKVVSRSTFVPSNKKT